MCHFEPLCLCQTSFIPPPILFASCLSQEAGVRQGVISEPNPVCLELLGGLSTKLTLMCSSPQKWSLCQEEQQYFKNFPRASLCGSTWRSITLNQLHRCQNSRPPRKSHQWAFSFLHKTVWGLYSGKGSTDK